MERDVLSWIESQSEEEQRNKNVVVAGPQKDKFLGIDDVNHVPSFKSMLESECYLNNNQLPQNQFNAFPSDQNDAFLMQPLDSSAFSFLPPAPPPQSCFSSFFNDNGFDLGSQSGYLSPFMMENEASGSASSFMGFSAQMSNVAKFPPSVELGTVFGTLGSAGPSNAALFSNKPNVLKPLEALSPVGIVGSSGLDTLGKRGWVMDGMNYDSDDVVEIGDNKNNSNDDDDKEVEDEDNGGALGAERKEKKKRRIPAKNLMAERRRRKKLKDGMYMLRSVVPKISKMDKASILGDAIDYMKELLQQINDLNAELESSSSGSSLPPTTSFQPLTPTLPCLEKGELCPTSLPSPKNQSAKVEVRVEGKAVNIHMFCDRRQGLFHSTMTALDNLGLDVQQAVISCFDGFALDVFRAEHCKDGQDVEPEQIKAVLLDTASFHSTV